MTGRWVVFEARVPARRPVWLWMLVLSDASVAETRWTESDGTPIASIDPAPPPDRFLFAVDASERDESQPLCTLSGSCDGKTADEALLQALEQARGLNAASAVTRLDVRPVRVLWKTVMFRATWEARLDPRAP